MADSLLMLIVRYGSQKDYVLDKFEECLRACVYPYSRLGLGAPGVDIIWAGDRPGDEIQIPPGLTMCADIVRYAREAARHLAIEGGYDKMLWQGVDALYQSRADFGRLISHDLPMVSALISARTDVTHACARRFHRVAGKWVPQQYDIPSVELMNLPLVAAGWPSVDNVVIDRALFDIDVMATCPEWYEQNNEALSRGQVSRDENATRGNLDHSEWFCLEAARRGHVAWIDTTVRVWHVHESGATRGGPCARLWPDLEVPLEMLTW